MRVMLGGHLGCGTFFTAECRRCMHAVSHIIQVFVFRVPYSTHSHAQQRAPFLTLPFPFSSSSPLCTPSKCVQLAFNLTLTPGKEGPPKFGIKTRNFHLCTVRSRYETSNRQAQDIFAAPSAESHDQPSETWSRLPPRIPNRHYCKLPQSETKTMMSNLHLWSLFRLRFWFRSAVSASAADRNLD